MLRSVLVGFILGFALVGVFRLSVPANMGRQLTVGQATNSGATVGQQVAAVPVGHGLQPGQPGTDYRPNSWAMR